MFILRMARIASIALGVMFVLVACGFAVRDLVRTVGAASATGEVIALTAEPGTNGGALYRPTVRFTAADSGPVTFTGWVASDPPAYSVGQQVHVFYDRAQPSSAMIDSFVERLLLPVVFGGIGIVGVGVGMVLGVLMRRRARVI
jgi:hypothetical protein